MAEREGFEPPEPRSSTVFKTAAIDHSAIFPGAKVIHFSKTAKFFTDFSYFRPSWDTNRCMFSVLYSHAIPSPSAESPRKYDSACRKKLEFS